MGALRELFAVFDIDVDTKKLEAGDKLVDSFKEKLGEVAKGVVAAFAVESVKSFIESQIEAGAQLGHTAAMLGTTAEELDAFTFAVQSSGGSAQTAATSLRFLNKNMGDAAAGSKEASAAFSSIGVKVSDANGQMRPALDVMADLADQMEKTDEPSKKMALAVKLLGRAGGQLIPTLNKGGEAIRGAREEMVQFGGDLTADFVGKAQKAEEAMVGLNAATTGLKREIMIAVLPGVMRFVDGLKAVAVGAIELEKRSHLMEDALFFLKSGAIAFGVYRIVGAMQALTSAQVLAAITNPFVLYVAGIGLALLAFNDLKVAVEGGSSVFGDIFGQTGVDQLVVSLSNSVTFLDILKTGAQALGDEFSRAYHWAALFFDEILVGAAHASMAAGSLRRGFGRLIGAKDEGPEGERAEKAGLSSAQADRDRASKGIDDDSAREDQRWKDLGVRAMDRDDRARKVTTSGAVGIGHTEHNYGGGAAVSPSAGFPYVDSAYSQFNTASVPGAAAPSHGGGGKGGAVVNQNNPVSIVINGATDPEKTGKAVSNGVATAQQRSLSHALTAGKRP